MRLSWVFFMRRLAMRRVDGETIEAIGGAGGAGGGGGGGSTCALGVKLVVPDEELGCCGAPRRRASSTYDIFLWLGLLWFGGGNGGGTGTSFGAVVDDGGVRSARGRADVVGGDVGAGRAILALSRIFLGFMATSSKQLRLTWGLT